MDFETSVIQTLREVFSKVNISGGNFHFNQSAVI